MVARLVLAGVLIVAGLLKIDTPALSVEAVRAYELLPVSLTPVVGYGLPVLEIVVGVFLAAGLLTRTAGVAGALLMFVFVVGIISAWARGLRIDCGCFGTGGVLEAWEEPNYLGTILRDIGLVALGVWVAWFPPGKFALDSALGLTSSRDKDDDEDLDKDEETV
ncbi:MauE/DoxX family redox-associated membrane protein [Sinosporangium siamense]|uniref:Methylamine utilisation protein MauE domain-containing protein n=1 Tax=Sinosporangium siamense TaxID=1367973 RepID=A0A919REF2_9ACTN|nr:MauE/DoxX family redox-associated membrane protein [Sinosporangium siamense]GII90371.1 hypothetical protein Ssi02_06020 [Sinosporangium siamense]